MGINLPGEVADLLNELGYTWPKADEAKLFQIGQLWNDFHGTLEGLGQDADGHAKAVWTDNKGESVDAFQRKWGEDDSAPEVLSDGTTAAQVIGVGMYFCAGIVLALKINVIVQITILIVEIIQAIATAAPTFGASLLEIPVFKKITGLIINFIISKAMEALLG